jgi:hypothetical protein
MVYSSSSIAEAGRPWRLQIGDVAVVPRPVSVVVAMRVDAALRNGDATAKALAVIELLSAAFPDPSWRHPLQRWQHYRHSPVKLIAQIDDEAIRRSVISALLTGPVKKPAPVATMTIEEQMHERHQAIASRASTGHAPSLAVIVATLRHALGESWYYNPARYDTTDGYVSMRQALVDFAGHHAVEAGAVLRDATAARLAQADAKEWRRATARLTKAASPEGE